MQKVPMTPAGYQRLEEEIRRLKHEERPAVIQAIAEARAHGDLSENAEYHAAKERQGWIEGQIIELEDKYTRAEVIDVAKFEGHVTVRFGATVTIVDEDTEEEKTWQIVGDYEADVKLGKVSISSPVARAMINKETGDSIEVAAPGGSRIYEILDVKYV